MQNAPIWKEIIGLLCPKDYGLFDEVNLAAEDPEGYFEEYQQELNERGIEDPGGISVWLAMIDGLLSRRCLVEVDFKASTQEMATSLEELAICREKKIDFSSLVASKANGDELLAITAALLEKHDLALGAPSLDSDSWPLVVIPTTASPRIMELAIKLGEKVTFFGPI